MLTKHGSKYEKSKISVQGCQILVPGDPPTETAALSGVSSRGAEGGSPPVGKTQARNPTAKPEVGQDLLGKGDS